MTKSMRKILKTFILLKAITDGNPFITSEVTEDNVEYIAEQMECELRFGKQ